jgi:Tudor domain
LFVNISLLHFRLIELNDSIVEFLDSTDDKAVHHPEIGLNCLVVFDELASRAKIIELVDDDSVKLLLVDLGETQIYGRDELLKTSTAIVEKLPFLAIKCNMVGIRPKEGDLWTEDIANSVYDEVIALCKSLFVRVIRKSDIPAPFDGMASYDVLLVDCTDEKQDVKINKKLITDGRSK